MPDLGIGELLATIGSTLGTIGSTVGSGITSGLGALGVGADTAATIGSTIGTAVPGVIEGAGLGAGTSAITGGNIGEGALTGGLTGGLLDVAAPALTTTASAAPTASSVSPAASAGGGTSAAATSLSGGLDSATVPLSSGPTLTGTDALPIAAGQGITPTVNLGANLNTTLPDITSSTATPPATAAAAETQPGLGTKVANMLNLGPETGAFLDKYGGDILQGGLLAYQSEAQRAALSKELAPLKSSAARLGADSSALSAAMFGGQLPQGAKEAVDLATQSAKARVRSTYAGLGLSGSTMEADALNQVDREAAAQTFQFANAMLQEGMNAAQMSDSLYSTIMQTQIQNDSNLSAAITNFAAQLLGAQTPGSGRTITLNLGG